MTVSRWVVPVRAAAARRASLLPPLVYGALAAAVLSRLLLRPGLIGFGWDWGYPPLAWQVRAQLAMRFEAWGPNSLGDAAVFPPDAFLWMAQSALAVAGAPVALKVTLWAAFGLAAWGMHRLVRGLGGGAAAAFAGALLYGYSPFMFSRLVAGHLQFLVGHALLPWAVLALLRFLDAPRFRMRDLVACALLVVGAAQSHVFLGLLLIVVAVVLAYALVADRLPTRRVAARGGALGVAVAALNLYWLVPLFASFGNLTRDYVARTSPAVFLRAASSDLLASLRLTSELQGLQTEVIYHAPGMWDSVWRVASLFLPMLAFSTLWVRPRARRISLFLTFAVLGIALTSFSRTAFASPLLFLLSQTGPLYGAFHNPQRFAPLTTLAYGVLVGLAVERLGGVARSAVRRWRPFSAHWGSRDWVALASPLAVGSLFVFPIAAFAVPFGTGGFETRPDFAPPDQPYLVMVTPVSPAYRAVAEDLRRQEGHAERMLFAPSPFMGYPVDYWARDRELFHISTGQFSLPDLGSTGGEPLARYASAVWYHDDDTPAEPILSALGVSRLVYADSDPFRFYAPEMSTGRFEARLAETREFALLAQHGETAVYAAQDARTLLSSPRRLGVLGGGFDGIVPALEAMASSPTEAVTVMATDLEWPIAHAVAARADALVLTHGGAPVGPLAPALRAAGLWIEPAAVIREWSPAWGPLRDAWWDEVPFAAVGGMGGVVGYGAALQTLPIQVAAGTYDLYALLYAGPAAAEISVSLDGSTLGSFHLADDVARGFEWVHLGRVAMGGNHELGLQGALGAKAVAALAAVPLGFDTLWTQTPWVLLSTVDAPPDVRQWFGRLQRQNLAVWPPPGGEEGASATVLRSDGSSHAALEEAILRLAPGDRLRLTATADPRGSALLVHGEGELPPYDLEFERNNEGVRTLGRPGGAATDSVALDGTAVRPGWPLRSVTVVAREHPLELRSVDWTRFSGPPMCRVAFASELEAARRNDSEDFLCGAAQVGSGRWFGTAAGDRAVRIQENGSFREATAADLATPGARVWVLSDWPRDSAALDAWIERTGDSVQERPERVDAKRLSASVYDATSQRPADLVLLLESYDARWTLPGSDVSHHLMGDGFANLYLLRDPEASWTARFGGQTVLEGAWAATAFAFAALTAGVGAERWLARRRRRLRG